MTSRQPGPASFPSPEDFRRFLHDVSGPLSAVALHLEAAARRVQKGEDAAAPLETARRELDKAFELFERGRESLTGAREGPAR
jgi:hypothetical protein